jgi:hypothetical protein
MAMVNDVAALLDETVRDVEKSPDSQNQFEDRTFEGTDVTNIDRELFTRLVARNNHKDLDNKEKMERPYTTYYLNQDNAAYYMDKYKRNCYGAYNYCKRYGGDD